VLNKVLVALDLDLDIESAGPPNWGIAPMGCGVWTTCPRLLLESAVVKDRTHDLAVIGSNTLTTRLPSHAKVFIGVDLLHSFIPVSKNTELLLQVTTPNAAIYGRVAEYE